MKCHYTSSQDMIDNISNDRYYYCYISIKSIILYIVLLVMLNKGAIISPCDNDL